MGEDLRFERFRSEFVGWAYGRSDWPGLVEKHVMERAYTAHSGTVMDALLANIGQSIAMSRRCRTNGASQNLLYGASRRLHMMWYAYRDVVVYSAFPGRTDPLSSDESSELTRDLNVIYINIRGTLDNLAWALLHEFAPEKVNIHPAKVGLFKSCIIGDSRFARLSSLLNAHNDWSLELAERRDPSAHRIPLTIPPQALTREEWERCQKLLNESQRATQNLDFVLADEKFKQTERIGRFYPCFIHDMDKGTFPIYPTVPEDVAHVIEIGEAVGSFFSPTA